ncbi:hypothetical protein TNCV_576921 [Trichonephila clavipes]|nr:hypothetical protein TNCV_576921 [Trichonephila clavipes]
MWKVDDTDTLQIGYCNVNLLVELSRIILRKTNVRSDQVVQMEQCTPRKRPPTLSSFLEHTHVCQFGHGFDVAALFLSPTPR